MKTIVFALQDEKRRVYSIIINVVFMIQAEQSEDKMKQLRQNRIFSFLTILIIYALAIWLGIIITIQCILGAISPPFGANIFTACAAFNVPYTKVVRGLPPYLIVMIGLSVLLIFFPQIITFYRAFL